MLLMLSSGGNDRPYPMLLPLLQGGLVQHLPIPWPTDARAQAKGDLVVEGAAGSVATGATEGR